MKQGRQGESSTVAVFVGKNSWRKSQVVDLSLVVAVSPNVKGNKKQAHVLDHRLNRTGAHDVLVKLWCLVAWAYWMFNIFWWWVTHSCSSGRDIEICFFCPFPCEKFCISSLRNHKNWQLWAEKMSYQTEFSSSYQVFSGTSLTSTSDPYIRHRTNHGYPWKFGDRAPRSFWCYCCSYTVKVGGLFSHSQSW